MGQDASETPVLQRDLFEGKGQNMYLCFRVFQIISVLYMFLGVCPLCLESVLPTAQQQAMWPELIQQQMIGQEWTTEPKEGHPYILARYLQIVWFGLKRNIKPIR